MRLVRPGLPRNSPTKKRVIDLSIVTNQKIMDTDNKTTSQSDQPDAESADDQSSETSDNSSASADDQATTADDPAIEMEPADSGDESDLAAAPSRPYGVESWRPLVTEMAGDIPIEVLLRWIKHESGGNPCATGKIVNGASIENGLFQLYSPDDDHIATPTQLHGS